MKALRFEGSGSEYFKIWIVNILLSIVTFGLYYPWAKVRNKRYFYANTTLEGRNFEYHATGKQLFVGFLISMVIFTIYMIISQVSLIGGLVVIAVLFLAIPWLIWKSLMFSMRMTSYSNVRFGFEGTLGQSYINFFVYPILFLVALYAIPIGATVGIPLLLKDTVPSWTSMVIPLVFIASFLFAFYMYALMKKKNTSYILNNTRYGQGEFITELKTRKFMGILLKTIGVSMLIMGVMSLLIGLIVNATVGMEALMELKDSVEDPVVIQEKIGELMPIFVPAYLGFILAVMGVMAYALTRQRTYVYENTTLDGKIGFMSTLRALPLAWVMISNVLLVLLTIGLAFPWAKVRMAKLMAKNTQVDIVPGFDAYITQQENKASSLGDQIGDAFDVDVGIGF